jgi:protein TonB
MKAELILQSDVLDIVFENKNKTYGAYELRKQYRRRLAKSILITIAVVIVFASLMSWKIPHKKGGVAFLPDDVTLHEYEMKKVEPKTAEPKKQSAPQHLEQKQFTAPIIVKSDSTHVPDQKELEKSLISTINKSGNEAGIDDVTPPPSASTGDGKEAEVKEIKEEVFPIYDAQVMPQYPGGIEALKKFIQRNTQQPDDLEEGQRIVVVAKFVVDASGNISNIAIEQKGRKDLDMEVMKVIKKMPPWIPGKQNGRSVPVYFRLPVTFMPQE